MKKGLIITLFTITFCISNFAFRFQQPGKREISFFRITGYFKNFCLKINDDFSYQENGQTKGNGAFGYFITKYKTASDTLHVYLKINESDTSFNYVLSSYDSLMLGGDNGHFFCWTKKEYIWAND